MKPIAYVSCNKKIPYDNDTFFGRIVDRFKISYLGERFIKELNLKISDINLPPNINSQSYYKNMLVAKRKVKGRDIYLAPKIYRELDYNYLNDFQRELIAFGIVTSSKLILRKMHKSIRDSCIVIYDAVDIINFNIICFMAKEAKYIVLLSRHVNELTHMAEYIIANFGITPIVTSDFKYAIENADFIIASKDVHLETRANIWYLNNMYIPLKKDNIIINDITYKVPWELDEDMSPELLGAILCQMEEENIEEALKYNSIFLDKIKFNDEVLIL